jgi:spermidine/putrescine transport system permease protein
VLPIYSALAQVDPALIESARDLGASRLQAVRRVVLPLAIRGVNAAFAVCLIIAAGDYVTPQLVGGANGQMIGNVINDQFGVAFNWPLGSALAFILLALTGLVFALWMLLMRTLGLRGVRA